MQPLFTPGRALSSPPREMWVLSGAHSLLCFPETFTPPPESCFLPICRCCHSWSQGPCGLFLFSIQSNWGFFPNSSVYHVCLHGSAGTRISPWPNIYHCSATCHLPSVTRHGTSWSLVAPLAQRELNLSHLHSCPGLCFLTSSYSFESRRAKHQSITSHGFYSKWNLLTTWIIGTIFLSFLSYIILWLFFFDPQLESSQFSVAVKMSACKW